MKALKGLDIIDSILIKAMLIIALYIPISLTRAGYKYLQYYQEIMLVNVVAVAFLLFYVITIIFGKRFNKGNNNFIILFFAALLGYLLFYGIMMWHIDWIWEGINCLISFGFFLLLMAGKNQEWFEKHHVISFANYNILISNIIGLIICFFTEYISVYWYNFKFELVLPGSNIHEERYNWIYYHKSQYAFMLLLSLAFVLVHRNKFRYKMTFGLTVAVLMTCLYVCHTNTALVGGGITLATFILDMFIRNFKKLAVWMKAIIIPVFVGGVIGAGVAAYMKIAGERKILTLGSRTYIWNATIRLLTRHPEGIGNAFSLYKIYLPELNTTVNNGHNVFFNEMLRFSYPVGFFFTVFFVLIIGYSLKKRFSVLTIGIWVALLMAVTMDYAVMSSGWTLMVFFFYTIFFLDMDYVDKGYRLLGRRGRHDVNVWVIWKNRLTTSFITLPESKTRGSLNR
ncbi:MAG: hypothetical protein LUF92_12880 [Clostridiales bacterium]|nr:hypothetical protein [Clostridiales bacterium]